MTLFKGFRFTIILTISITKIFFFSFYFSYLHFFQFFSFLSCNCFWIHFFKFVCLIFIFAFLLKSCALGSETTFNNWKPFTYDEKMLFYFTLKGLLLLNIFLFNIIFSIFFSIFLYIYICLDFLVMYKNGLIRKIRLLSKFMVSRPGKQTIAIHYCPISQKSKNNQTMNFVQLIECNMRNSFLEKSNPKYGGESIPRPFSKKLNLSISLDQESKVLYSLFSLYDKLRAIQIY